MLTVTVCPLTPVPVPSPAVPLMVTPAAFAASLLLMTLSPAMVPMAMVGAEGCRRPIEKVVPYTKMPEDVIPGVASHYATVIQRRGDALGLVVESHEGRPTKIEGSETHPSSLGAADLVV